MLQVEFILGVGALSALPWESIPNVVSGTIEEGSHKAVENFSPARWDPDLVVDLTIQQPLEHWLHSSVLYERRQRLGRAKTDHCSVMWIAKVMVSKVEDGEGDLFDREGRSACAIAQ